MEMVEHLITVAEISVALAGFAGIIATFQLWQIEHVSRGRVLALWMVVNISLRMAFISGFPLVLLGFGVDGGVVWAICSALLAIGSITESPFIIRNMNLQRENYSTRILFGSLMAVGAILVVINILNALGVVFHNEFGPFFALILFHLSIVGWNFSRLLMRPLWKMVEEREAATSSNG